MNPIINNMLQNDRHRDRIEEYVPCSVDKSILPSLVSSNIFVFVFRSYKLSNRWGCNCDCDCGGIPFVLVVVVVGIESGI